MPVTPTGYLTQCYFLRKMVAACATFRTVTGAANATDAEAFIYYPAADGEDESPWPRAIITTSDNFGRRRTALATWETTGTLKLTLEFIVPPDEATSFENAFNWFSNQVAAIMSEMETLCGTGEPVAGQTHLNLTAITFDGFPYFVPPAEISHLISPGSRSLYAAWGCVLDVEFY